MQPKFKAIVKETGEEIGVIGLEFNNAGVTWVTLMRGIPKRSNLSYGPKPLVEYRPVG